MSSLTSSPEPRARPVLGFLPRGVGFWLLAGLLGLLVFASSAPSPLYGVYQQKWQFSATTLTAIFGVYARVRGRGGHQRAERGTDRPAATGQHPRTGREQLHPWVWIGTWSAGHQRAGRVRPRADPPDLVAAAGRVRAGHPGGSRGTPVGGASSGCAAFAAPAARSRSPVPRCLRRRVAGDGRLVGAWWFLSVARLVAGGIDHGVTKPALGRSHDRPPHGGGQPVLAAVSQLGPRRRRALGKRSRCWPALA